MSREWKPGDVVAVGVEPTHRAMRTSRKYEGGEQWRFDDGTAWDGAGPVRQLVVIDPEDREQVARLLDLFGFDGDAEQIDQMRAALRSLIEPPKVFAHYPSPALDEKARATAMCGKVWRPESDPKDCERCPECSAIVEASWSA